MRMTCLAFVALSLSVVFTGCGEGSTAGLDDLTDVSIPTTGIPGESTSPDFGQNNNGYTGGTDEKDNRFNLPEEEGGEEGSAVGEEGGSEGVAETAECVTEENCAQDNLPACMKQVCLQGSCELVAAEDGFPCDDGDNCTSETFCDAANGGCVGVEMDCDDGNPCTTDQCNASLGCQSNPNQNLCDDGNACTSNDFCENAQCVAGTELTCDDNNPCTADICDPLDGCVNTPDDLADCSDNQVCTEGDSCVEGTCIPGEVVCPTCSEEVACPEPGDLCAPTYACVDEFCIAQPGTGVDCNDNKPCTIDACVPDTGECIYDNEVDGTLCEDGNDCTLQDSCLSGSCVSDTNAAGGSLCDDGNPCTVNDTCSLGSCTPGELQDPCIPGCIPSNEPGCGGCACEDCVCAIDNFCCSTQWDESCVNLCQDDCGLSCEDTTNPGNPGTSGECAGFCGGSALSGCYCDEECILYGDCCPNICTDCPTLSHCGGGSGCIPNCGFNECGDDGCGGSCGTCLFGDTCVAGICIGGGGGGAGSCAGNCDSSASGCWCDESCAGFGDCCPDVCSACPFLSHCGGGIPGSCPAGQVLDCDGICVSVSYLGNGSCDDGSLFALANLNCAQNNFDNGDCGGGGLCGAGQIENCTGGCTTASWLGDGFCDFSLDCAATNYDNGDCGDGTCPAGQIQNCTGGCTSASWLADGFCDSALDCAETNFDEGDCASCVPQCGFNTCGDDGCGGSCGTCGFNQVCVEGTCVDEGPVCGNGVIEEGEICDGDCPIFCFDDDNDSCTSETLIGSSVDCTSECIVEPTTVCESFDGCCPEGCTYDDDFDCPAPYCGDGICGEDEDCLEDCCGNGILDTGETCDGDDCPTEGECEEQGTACNPGFIKGSASTCSAICEFNEILFCLDGDGCCPESCESEFSQLDDDCPEPAPTE